MMMMSTKDRRDIKPFLVKIGVALAISFAGLAYTRIKAKRIKPSNPPRSRSPRISDSDRKSDYEGRFRIRDDPQHELDSVPSNPYEEPCIRVRVDTTPTNASPSARCCGDKDGLLLLELDQLVREFSMTSDHNHVVSSRKKDMKTFKFKKEPHKILTSVERDEYEKEIENLKRKIRLLREQERNLEVKLLEHSSLKEKETTLRELQSRLKINDIESKLFSLKIESLQADNKRLEAQVADHSKVVGELEGAKAKIKLLKRKIRNEAEEHKERILELTHRVGKLQEQEEVASCSYSDLQLELQRVKELQIETKELKMCNRSLQQENADLGRRLESTQLLAHSILEDPEKEEHDKERLRLREENSNQSMEIEKLKADRCKDAEELVYLRWINACLRYELRNYKPEPGKAAARDLSKSLSPKSEKKAKQLILQYANSEDADKDEPSSIVDFDLHSWPSSQPSYLTDHSSSSQNSLGNKDKRYTKKKKFFTKLRKLIRGKKQNTSIPRSLSVDDLGRSFDQSSPRSGSPASESRQPLSSLAEEDSSSAQSSPVELDYSRPKGKADDGTENKSELAKYAEVLRESEVCNFMQKKAASIG